MSELPFGHEALSKISAEVNELFAQDTVTIGKRLGHHHTCAVGNILRERLIRTIEKAIGRELCHKSANAHGNRFGTYFKAWIDDPQPPNCYEWRFTEEYPAFPTSGITSWALPQSRACNEALERGWLYVVEVEPQGPVVQKKKRRSSVEQPERTVTLGSPDLGSPRPHVPEPHTYETPSPEPESPEPQMPLNPTLYPNDDNESFNTLLEPLLDNWKELNQRIRYQESELEELRAANEAQTARILELEKNAEENDSDAGFAAALGCIATELGKYKKENDDLESQNASQETMIASLREEIRGLRSNSTTSMTSGSPRQPSTTPYQLPGTSFSQSNSLLPKDYTRRASYSSLIKEIQIHRSTLSTSSPSSRVHKTSPREFSTPVRPAASSSLGMPDALANRHRNDIYMAARSHTTSSKKRPASVDFHENDASKPGTRIKTEKMSTASSQRRFSPSPIPLIQNGSV